MTFGCRILVSPCFAEYFSFKIIILACYLNLNDALVYIIHQMHKITTRKWTNFYFENNKKNKDVSVSDIHNSNFTRISF